MNLFEDVDERWWHHHTLGDGEAQSHGLAGLVVGVLADDDNLDLVERREVESVEDKVPRGIAGTLMVFPLHGLGELLEIGRLKLWFQPLFPGRFYLDIHDDSIFVILS